MNLLAQVDPKSFWNAPSGSPELFTKLFIALVVGIALAVGLLYVPSQARKYIIFTVTFVSGLFYFLFWIFPSPISRQPTDAPRGPVEAFSFWISDSQSVVQILSNVIQGFMIGLGIYSLLRVHLMKIVKQQRDWGYSAVLVVCLFVMATFGYVDYFQHKNPANFALADPKNWGFINYGKDLLFDGLLQNMDAGMFSVVAFYIMSAAYRAFRARSMEATILLVTALIVMLSLMGAVEFVLSNFIDSHTPASGAGRSLMESLKLSEISTWLRSNVQTPAIRGIDFGVGIGLLAMAVRLWLNLEKTGGNV